MNIAIIGVGRWGKNIVRTIINEIPAVNIVAIVSRNPSNFDHTLLGTDCNVYGNVEELLSTEKSIDGLVAALPPSLNYDLSKKVIPKGVPLFIEKPMSLSVLECQKMLKLASDYNSIVRVNHIDLFNPAVVEIDRQLDCKPKLIEGVIGAAYDCNPIMSPLWEYSPHFIAASMWLMRDRPIRVSAKRVSVDPNLSTHTHREMVTFDLIYECGSVARITAGNGIADKTRKLKVIDNKCSYYFKDRADEPLVKECIETLNREAIQIETDLPLTQSLRSFFSSVEQGIKDTSSFETGLNVVEILTAIDRSLATGVNVELL